MSPVGTGSTAKSWNQSGWFGTNELLKKIKTVVLVCLIMPYSRLQTVEAQRFNYVPAMVPLASLLPLVYAQDLNDFDISNLSCELDPVEPLDSAAENDNFYSDPLDEAKFHEDLSDQSEKEGNYQRAIL